MAIHIAQKGMNLAEVGETIGVRRQVMFKWAIARRLIASDGFPLHDCRDLFMLDARRNPLSGSMTAWLLTNDGADVVNDLLAEMDTNPQNFKG